MGVRLYVNEDENFKALENGKEKTRLDNYYSKLCGDVYDIVADSFEGGDDDGYFLRHQNLKEIIVELKELLKKEFDFFKESIYVMSIATIKDVDIKAIEKDFNYLISSVKKMVDETVNTGISANSEEKGDEIAIVARRLQSIFSSYPNSYVDKDYVDEIITNRFFEISYIIETCSVFDIALRNKIDFRYE